MQKLELNLKETSEGSISQEDFIKIYWQKKPLLIRNAINITEINFNRDDLASLALIEEIDARIVTSNKEDYKVQLPPYKKKQLKKFPKEHASLVVRNVDSYSRTLKRQWSKFNFIPEFNREDIMVSFASDKGGVGPHLDSYDVFMLQLTGKKDWYYSDQPLQKPKLLKNDSIQLLSDTSPLINHCTLEPGDILYLPEHYGHNGISDGNSINVSFAFRSLNNQVYQSLLADFLTTDEIEKLSYRIEDADLQINQALSDLKNNYSDIQSSIEFKCYLYRFLSQAFIGEFIGEEPPSNKITHYPIGNLRSLQFEHENDLFFFINGFQFEILPSDGEVSQKLSNAMGCNLEDKRHSKQFISMITELIDLELISKAK